MKTIFTVLKYLFLVCFFVLSLIFAVQNVELFKSTQILNLDLWFWKTQTPALPIYAMVVLAAIIGAAVPVIFIVLDRLGARFTIRGYKKKISLLEKELTTLRELTYDTETSTSQETLLAAQKEDLAKASKPIACPPILDSKPESKDMTDATDSDS